jgi:hypothetical protein
MRKKVTTTTGSIYVIDEKNKKWERISSTDQSGDIRTDSGNILNQNPINFVIGKSIVIATDPFTSGTIRFIGTSAIVSVEEIE